MYASGLGKLGNMESYLSAVKFDFYPTLGCHDIQKVRKKVQVGNDQEKAQSEKRFPLQKPRWGKTN